MLRPSDPGASRNADRDCTKALISPAADLHHLSTGDRKRIGIGQRTPALQARIPTSWLQITRRDRRVAACELAISFGDSLAVYLGNLANAAQATHHSGEQSVPHRIEEKVPTIGISAKTSEAPDGALGSAKM